MAKSAAGKRPKHSTGTLSSQSRPLPLQCVMVYYIKCINCNFLNPKNLQICFFLSDQHIRDLAVFISDATYFTNHLKIHLISQNSYSSINRPAVPALKLMNRRINLSIKGIKTYQIHQRPLLFLHILCVFIEQISSCCSKRVRVQHQNYKTAKQCV